MSANTPKHYGFAQVPRQILRGEKYKKNLSLAEKGLYSCLKDICGDTGECYYSLRNLATEIGTSASTLTRLIPALRDAGLIYAEKKVRGTAENRHEIWHIRIVNIWQENDALYQPEECSKMKQSSVSEENNTPSASTSVSNCNENTGLFQNETGLFQNEIKIVSFCLPNNNNSNNNLTEEDKEESTASDSAIEPFAPNVALSPISQSSSLFSEEEMKPEEKAPSKKKEKTEPVMPLQDAPWPSRETAVQIVEAKKGRIYSDMTRKQELQEAGKILEMTVDNAPITREQFERAWDELTSSSWWDEHGKPCMIKYLRRDDTIVGIVKKLKRKGKPSSNPQAQIVDMEAERERARIKNEQQLQLMKERQRKRAEALKAQGEKQHG